MIAGLNSFRHRLLWMVAGNRPDARTRFEVSRGAFAEHQVFRHGRSLVATLQRLDWEETIFGLPCWHFHLGTAPADTVGLQTVAASVQPPGIIWTRIASEHTAAMRALRKQGFERLLEMTNLQMPFAHWQPSAIKAASCIRRATPRDAAALGRIAGRMFSQDRFHADCCIERRRADCAHAEWARNAALGKVADQTLVALDGNHLAGFHALKWLDTPRGRVGLTVLIGVSAACQGRGLGRALLLSGLAALQRGGARWAWVRTESSNAAATRLYEAAGFVPQTTFWYLRKYNP